MLNYKKGLSKEAIRKLSAYFKVSQEAFNRPHKLNVPENSLYSHRAPSPHPAPGSQLSCPL